MKNALIAVIVLVLLGVGYWLYTQQTPVEENNNPAGIQQTTDETGMPIVPEGPAGEQPGTDTEVHEGTLREFTVTGSNFTFSPATMTVKKGDTVRVTFKNQSGTHDWILDEFNAKTKILNGGQEETVEFIADKAGTFEYYCGVGQHRQMGMKGTLTVTE